jgi:hypothetical protein
LLLSYPLTARPKNKFAWLLYYLFCLKNPAFWIETMLASFLRYKVILVMHPSMVVPGDPVGGENRGIRGDLTGNIGPNAGQLTNAAKPRVKVHVCHVQE